MTDIPRLKAANAARWAAMHTTPDLGPALDRIAGHLVAPSAKPRYLAVETKTHVPWFIVAVIHEREASQSWWANLAQGDRWDRVSIHVPKGQGPFHNWEDAACNALSRCWPFAARWTDWSAGGALTLLEEYNGLGYAERGVPSPYLWAATDQYHRGKFIADGHYDPDAVDRQFGCAALLSRMKIADLSIDFGAPGNPDNDGTRIA